MPHPETPERPRRNAPRWLKAWLALHIVAITSWSLPPPRRSLLTGQEALGIRTDSPQNAFRSAGSLLSDGLLLVNARYVKESAVKPYLFSTGFWQYWDMFAPNPAREDYYLTAKITLKDGRQVLYRYPRIYELPIASKYLHERYRKFLERARLERYRYVWAPFAQRAAWKVHDDPSNPPVKVELVLHTLHIAPPGQPQPTEYKPRSYFTYWVDQRRLAEKFGSGTR